MGILGSKPGIIQSITKLAEQEDLSVLSDEFWLGFWTDIPNSHEVLASIPNVDIKNLREKNPKAFMMLIQKTANVITGFFKSKVPTTRAASQEVLNCVRILTRMLPFAFEDAETNEQVLQILCPGSNSGEEWDGLLYSTIGLLFTPRISQCPSLDSEGSKVFYTIWRPGLGSGDVLEENAEICLNRHDVMKLLLVQLAWGFYLDIDATSPTLFVVCCMVRQPVAVAILYSLLNSICLYENSRWGIFPYGHLFFPDESEQIMATEIQVLNLLLNFDNVDIGNCTTKDLQYLQRVIPEFFSEKRVFKNTFQHYLSLVEKESELNFVSGGIYNLLSRTIRQYTELLPGSVQPIRSYPEILLLFWRLLESNSLLEQVIVSSSGLNEILSLLIQHMGAMGGSGQLYYGALYMTGLIFLRFSSRREFSVKLNRQKGPDETYADFFISSICKMVGKSKQTRTSIGECTLMALANISPFIKTLSFRTSEKLMWLLETLSKPALLYGEDGAYYIFFTYLIDTFRNLIHYQSDGNSAIIYSLLGSRRLFADASGYTYDEYLAMKKGDGDVSGHVLSEKEFAERKNGINVDSLLHLLNVLSQEIEGLYKTYGEEDVDPGKIIQHLRSMTFVGILPPQQQIQIRGFGGNSCIAKWLKQYLFCAIYAHNTGLHLWTGTTVKVFHVKIMPRL